jgi:hypothetical protein
MTTELPESTAEVELCPGLERASARLLGDSIAVWACTASIAGIGAAGVSCRSVQPRLTMDDSPMVPDRKLCGRH